MYGTVPKHSNPRKYLLDSAGKEDILALEKRTAVIIGHNQNAYAKSIWKQPERKNHKIAGDLQAAAQVFHDLNVVLNYTFISSDITENRTLNFKGTYPILKLLALRART